MNINCKLIATTIAGVAAVGSRALPRCNVKTPTQADRLISNVTYAHFRHIPTSGDGFRIADPHFLFIFNSDYGSSTWLSFRDIGTGQCFFSTLILLVGSFDL